MQVASLKSARGKETADDGQLLGGDLAPRLVHGARCSGAHHSPFGSDAEGFIAYSADGRMAVQFGAANRPRLPDPDWIAGADVDIAAAARDYFAYCGTYEVQMTQ